MKTLVVSLVTAGFLIIALGANAACDVGNVDNFLIDARAKAFEGSCSTGTHVSHRSNEFLAFSEDSKWIFVTHGQFGEPHGGVLRCAGGKWYPIEDRVHPDGYHTYTVSCH